MAMNNEKEMLVQAANSMPDYAEQIAEMVKGDLSPKTIQERLDSYHDGDIANAVQLLELSGRTRLFRAMEPEKLADVFEYIEPESAAEYLEQMDVTKSVLIIGKMESDAAADVLREFPKDRRNQVIELLDDDFRRKMEMIVSFDEDEIGSRMSTNYISLNSEMTVAEATRALMTQAKENDNISTLFVTAENGFFCGAVELRALLTAEKHAMLAPLIQTSFPYVYGGEKTESCIERLKNYSESSVPVLDSGNRILGVITLESLVEAVDDEMGDDYAKLGGLSAEEDLHEPLSASLKKRMPWLLVLLVLGMAVSGVVGAFEKVVSQLTIIMAFQSLILDMAGNVGTQSLAVTIRVLMDKDLAPGKKFRLVCKEMRVGLFCGLILGVLSIIFVGLYIMLVKGYLASFAFAVSLCIGAALMLAMLISSGVGTLVPIFFKKIGVDPAVASGPLITTVNDLVAVVTYYGLSWLLLLQVLHLGG